MERAVLLLEDGMIFEGEALGAQGEACGEVVFNTSITGYQEVLTDPSYRGQIVTMTYPLIGNYGIVPGDNESRGTWLSGFVVREASKRRSNWRSTEDLDSWLAAQGVVGIQGIDTRALTRHLRIEGAKHGIISSIDLDGKSLEKKLSRGPAHRRNRPGEGSDMPLRLRVDGRPARGPCSEASPARRGPGLRGQAQYSSPPRTAGSRVTVVPAGHQR